MNKIKKEYLSPELTVVEFKVERGYAASETGPNKISAMAQRFQMYADAAMDDANLSEGSTTLGDGGKMIGGYIDDEGGWYRGFSYSGMSSSSGGTGGGWF